MSFYYGKLPRKNRLKKPSIPVKNHPRVEAWVRYFTEDEGGRRIFGTWLKRRGKYRPATRTAPTTAGEGERGEG